MEQSTLSDSTRMPAAQVETRDPEQEARVAALLTEPVAEPVALPDAAIIVLADAASLEELTARIRCNAAEDPPKGEDGPSFFDRSYDLLEQVTATRPSTLAGIAAKARVMLTHVGRGTASDQAHDLGSDHAVCQLAVGLARDAIRVSEARPYADAALIDLGRQWERAAAFYAAKHAEMVAVGEAAKGTGPGPAPRGAGPAHQKWLTEVHEWRDRTGVGEAEKASGDALTALGEVEDLIAAAKAATPEGLRVKARVGQRCEDTEIEWPDGLAAGLVADLLNARELHPGHDATDAEAQAVADAIEELWPEWAALNERDWDDNSPEAEHRCAAMYERRMALIRAAEALPAASSRAVRYAKALALAWLDQVDTWTYGRPVSDYTTDGRLVLSIEASLKGAPAWTGEDAGSHRKLAEHPEPAEPNHEDIARALHRAVDLKTLGIKDLSHLALWTEALMTMASGLAPRGGRRPLGRFFDQLSVALSDVVGRAQDELRTRTPSDAMEREYRTKTIALPVIENGDADELESLITDLQIEIAYLRQPAAAEVAR